MKMRIVIEQDEDGRFVAACPTLPAEAIAGYIESLRKHNEPIPPPITEEIIEVQG